MSRHSKWSKIKHEKGATDLRRGATFTKVLRTIEIAARMGDDPAANATLRLAFETAKHAGVPKDTIERAVARGTGADKEGVPIKTVVYEAIGPGGVGLLIEVMTDNKNRAMGEVRRILGDFEITLASAGSVSWQFAKKGVVQFPLPTACPEFISVARPEFISGGEGGEVGKMPEDIQLALIDSGAEDIREEDAGITIITAPDKLQTVSEAARTAGLTVEYADLEWIPKERTTISDDLRAKVASIIQAIEENEEVNAVYSTID